MRALPFFFDIMFLALFVAFMMTQVIVPLWRDRPLFPILKNAPAQT